MKKSDNNLIEIRLLANNKNAQRHAELIAEIFEQTGYEILKISNPYPCRSPQDDQSRIYLTIREK